MEKDIVTTALYFDSSPRISDIADAVLKCLFETDSALKLFALKTLLPQYISTDSRLNDVIFELACNGKITFTSEGIIGTIQSLSQFLKSISQESDKELLTRVLSGTPIKQITIDDPMMTGAIIHKRIKKILLNHPRLIEDKYKNDFERYNFPENIFTELFSETNATYIYLNEVYKRGLIDWRMLRFDSNRTVEFRTLVNKLLLKNGLYINDEIIPVNSRDMVLYILKQHRDESITFVQVYSAYNTFIDENKLDFKELQLTQAKLDYLFRQTNDVLRGRGKQIRYRLADVKKDRRLIDLLKLSNFKNIQVSTLKIFRENRGLLLENGIFDEHELYDFLKRNPNFVKKHRIVFKKTPMITFGKGNAEAQTLVLLKEMSPATGEALGKKYEELYGVRSGTFRSVLLRKYDRYLQDGLYDISMRRLTVKDIRRIKRAMSREWYFKDEAEMIFKERLGENAFEFYNSFNLIQLGFKLTAELIYANTYMSAEQCLDKNLCNGDVFEIDNKLWHLPIVYNMLNKKMESLDIVEFAPQQYVTIQCLKKHGIYKKDLRAYASDVCSYVKDEEYFTLVSIQNLGFTSKLDACGFDDMFYYSLLRKNRKLQTRRVNGEYLFRKSKKDATIADFIEYIVSSFISIDIYDLSTYLLSTYGIEFSVFSIRNATKDNSLYYDSITEKVYIDYDAYFEEV